MGALLRVRLRGDVYLASSLFYGFLATEEEFRTGQESFAHIFPDGKIRRYGEVIGDAEELEVIEEDVHVEPDPEAWANVALWFMSQTTPINLN